MFFTEPYTAKKETIIKMKLRPVHQNGTKNSNGVTIQWIKHKVDEAAPKCLNFLILFSLIFN